MNILVTGAKGFVGKNLCSQLDNIATNKARWYKVPEITNIFYYDVDSDPAVLDEYCQKADYVFNLAGTDIANDHSAYMAANYDFTKSLLELLKKYQNNCPVMYASSSHAEMNTSYGESKSAGEQLMFDYAEETGARVLVYRFPQIFGKWCQINYNSEVGTFCYNVANDIPFEVEKPDEILNLVFVDDVVDELINGLTCDEFRQGKFCYVPMMYRKRVGEIVDLLYKYDTGRVKIQIPLVSDFFNKALYSTYTSFLPPSKISYPIDMKVDDRGSFTEFIRTQNHGQVSINISKPGITKGQHWHHNFVERFLVVSGRGLMQMRKEGVDENGDKYPVLNFEISGDKLEVVETLAGYTHNLINLSDKENLVTVIWGSDCFNPNRPDTYFDPVE